MTDPTPWAPPGGAPAEPAAAPFTPPGPQPVPPVAPPAPQQAAPFGAPPGSVPPPGGPGPQPWTPPPQQGWTPPPKPGLIPLRPLTLGPLLGASFQVMRRNPRPTFGLSLLLSGGVSVLALLISGVIIALAWQRVVTAAPGDADAILSGSLAISFIAMLIPAGVAFGAFAVLQGVISLEVARGTLGEKLRLRGLLRMARGRIGVLIGWAAILLGAVAAAFILIAIMMFGLGVAFGAGGVLFGGLLGFLVGAAMFVLGAWLFVKTSLVPSVLMMERLTLRAAIIRSWRLTDGYFWRTLGIQLLVAVIIGTATNIVTQPIALVGFLFIGLANPMDDLGAYLTGMAIVYLLTLIVSLIASAIGLIVQSAATALIYLDLRMRKEGLDVELVRFVEARQAGDASVPDPYLPRSGGYVPSPAGGPWS